MHQELISLFEINELIPRIPRSLFNFLILLKFGTFGVLFKGHTIQIKQTTQADISGEYKSFCVKDFYCRVHLFPITSLYTSPYINE